MITKEITVFTEVNAEISKVWDFWTNPKHIINWHFEDDDWLDWICTDAENDLKTGWKFNFILSDEEWTWSFYFSWIYILIEELKHIKYEMMEDWRKVEIIFEELWDKTKITETFDMEDINSEELQRAGWQSILENFKKYLENN